MWKGLKKFFGYAEEVETPQDVVVQKAFDGDDAIMKNAMLAIQTGKVVYGDFEEGTLTSRISQVDDD